MGEKSPIFYLGPLPQYLRPPRIFAYTVFAYSIGEAMPAIRYTHNGSFKIVTHAPLQPNEFVPVRLKNGKSEMVEWLGFICLAATNLIPGKKAKIVAREIAQDEGRWRAIWHPVNDDQNVFGWLIERYTEERMYISIYGVVDNNGWPIIVDKEPGPKTKKISATVTEIQRRKSA